MKVYAVCCDCGSIRLRDARPCHARAHRAYLGTCERCGVVVEVGKTSCERCERECQGRTTYSGVLILDPARRVVWFDDAKRCVLRVSGVPDWMFTAACGMIDVNCVAEDQEIGQ